MENNLIKYIVYCTTCTENKKIYIGVHKTFNVEVFDGYIGCGVYINVPSTYSSPKTRFLYAVKKYGPKKFIRNTIAIYDNEEDAYFLESELVDESFLSRSDVYNMALGGGLPLNVSIIVYCYDEEGNFIKEYPSIISAAKDINRDLHSIQRALHYKHKCANFFWTKEKFDKLDLSKMYQYTGPKLIPVFQYDNKGEYECCYDSIKIASKVLGIHDSNIGKAIKLGTICHNKYFTAVYSQNFSIAKSTQINSCEVYQYDLEGNYIASYKNMTQAKKALGIKTDIYKAIKLGNCAGGFQWSFEKLPTMPKIKLKSGRARRVGKFDKDWNLISEYPSLSACKKENGASMEHVLAGRNEFSKGYRYKYLN